MTGKRLPETWRGGDEMKKLVVAFDDQFYADLKELSRRRQTTMASLIRYAVDKTFEDELDLIAGERGYEEHLRDPSSSMPWEEFKKELSLGVRNSTGKSGKATTNQTPGKRKNTNSAGNKQPRIRSVS